MGGKTSSGGAVLCPMGVYILFSIRTREYQLVWSLNGVMQSVISLVGGDIVDGGPYLDAGISYSCKFQAYFVEYL